MEDITLNIQNVEQFMSVENIGEKIKERIIEHKIEQNEDGTTSLIFILDNKGKNDAEIRPR